MLVDLYKLESEGWEEVEGPAKAGRDVRGHGLHLLFKQKTCAWTLLEIGSLSPH